MSQVEKSDLLCALFEEGGYTIRYKIIDDELWIRADDLAAPLNKSRQAVFDNYSKLPNEWRCQVELVIGVCAKNVNFVNKRGALKIIMKTRAKNGSLIDKFQNWAVTKLDELLTTGQSSLYDKRLQSVESWLESIKSPHSYKESRVREAIVKNTVSKLKEQKKTPNMDIPMCIENRLVYKFNLIDPKQIRSFSIGLGRNISKIYYAQYGDHPQMEKQNVWGGKCSLVKVYDPSEYEEWIDEVIEDYIRNRS